jgi:hypothetical protein
MNWMGLILIAVGLFSMAGAAFDWDWYMNNHRARVFVRLVGRTGARIFYILLGLVFASFGTAIMFGFTYF